MPLCAVNPNTAHNVAHRCEEWSCRPAATARKRQRGGIARVIPPVAYSHGIMAAHHSASRIVRLCYLRRLPGLGRTGVDHVTHVEQVGRLGGARKVAGAVLQEGTHLCLSG